MSVRVIFKCEVCENKEKVKLVAADGIAPPDGWYLREDDEGFLHAVCGEKCAKKSGFGLVHKEPETNDNQSSPTQANPACSCAACNNSGVQIVEISANQFVEMLTKKHQQDAEIRRQAGNN